MQSAIQDRCPRIQDLHPQPLEHIVIAYRRRAEGTRFQPQCNSVWMALGPGRAMPPPSPKSRDWAAPMLIHKHKRRLAREYLVGDQDKPRTRPLHRRSWRGAGLADARQHHLVGHVLASSREKRSIAAPKQASRDPGNG